MPLDPPWIDFCRPCSTRMKIARAGRASLAAGGAVAALAVAAGPALGAPTLPANWLREGNHGRAVGQLQHALHLRTSDVFDRGTERAVVRFQRRHKLQVDGIVGPQTWDVLFGITPAVLATPAASTTSTGGVAGGETSSGYSIPSAIVQCESGGNYSAVNASSGAGGAYQILPSTWRAYGGQGLPQNASPAEQGRIAAEIYANQGPSAWSC